MAALVARKTTSLSTCLGLLPVVLQALTIFAVGGENGMAGPADSPKPAVAEKNAGEHAW